MNFPDSLPFLRAARSWCGANLVANSGWVVTMYFLIAARLEPFRSLRALMASNTIWQVSEVRGLQE